MEIQHFEYGNLMFELQNLHPEEKKEYFDRNALFFKKCRKEIKIQNEGNPTTINTPKLGLNSAHNSILLSIKSRALTTMFDSPASFKVETK